MPPTDAEDWAVFAATAHDKKFSSKGMVMILPVGIGECRIVDDITEAEVRLGIQAVLDLVG